MSKNRYFFTILIIANTELSYCNSFTFYKKIFFFLSKIAYSPTQCLINLFAFCFVSSWCSIPLYLLHSKHQEDKIPHPNRMCRMIRLTYQGKVLYTFANHINWIGLKISLIFTARLTSFSIKNRSLQNPHCS